MLGGRNADGLMDQREAGLKPLDGFRLKAGLRREGSPARTYPSEYRLQGALINCAPYPFPDDHEAR